MPGRRLFFAVAALAVLAGCEARFPDEPPVDLQAVESIRAAVEEGAGGGQAVAEALRDPTGWGTLKGVFKVNGSPPAMSPLSAAATHQDARICAPNGEAPRSEAVVVGPDGGLAGVVVYLSTSIPTDPENGPKWLHESYEAVRNAEVEFDQQNCIFTSHVAAMWTTQTLRILNSDPIGHNTKIDPKGGARPLNQTIGPNASITYQPGGEERSPAPVSCSIHPWMQAYLLPRDNPYFAVTDETGAFEIPNLPAGVELEFRVWQPSLEYIEGVAPEGSSEPLSNGRVTLTLNPDETRDFNVTLDASMFQ